MQVIVRNRCQAVSAYDTAICAIKYWDNSSWIYHHVGQNGISFGKEGMPFRSSDDDSSQLFYTVNTPEQLGIRGAQIEL